MNYEMLLATHNKHKLQEVRKILSPHKITVYGLDDLLLKPEFPEETADTYAGNALIKAEAIQKLTTFPIIADDSGLDVEVASGADRRHRLVRGEAPDHRDVREMEQVLQEIGRHQRQHIAHDLAEERPLAHIHVVTAPRHRISPEPVRAKKNAGAARRSGCDKYSVL